MEVSSSTNWHKERLSCEIQFLKKSKTSQRPSSSSPPMCSHTLELSEFWCRSKARALSNSRTLLSKLPQAKLGSADEIVEIRLLWTGIAFPKAIPIAFARRRVSNSTPSVKGNFRPAAKALGATTKMLVVPVKRQVILSRSI